MTAQSEDATRDLHATIAILRAQLEGAVARETKHEFDYAEHALHQEATLDVLKAMSASPGDPQPAFDLIARHAERLCNVPPRSVAMFVFDGKNLHIRSWGWNPEPAHDYLRQFPGPPQRSTAVGRAILEQRLVHIRNVDDDPDISQTVRTMGVRSTVAIPMIHNGLAIGVIAVGSPTVGGYSDGQIALLQTFAEQAMIAITSAETYRALQERTAALAQRNTEYGERIEHQSATIDVLKVMSASPGDPQSVFDLIVERARELCEGYGATILEFDGKLLLHRASTGIDDDPAIRDAIIATYPKPAEPEPISLV